MLHRIAIIFFSMSLCGCLVSNPSRFSAIGTPDAGQISGLDVGVKQRSDPRSFLASVPPDDGLQSPASGLDRIVPTNQFKPVWNISTRGHLDKKHLDQFRSAEITYLSSGYNFMIKEKHKLFQSLRKRETIQELEFLEPSKLTREQFLADIAKVQNDVLLYVHGFNNSPDAATERVVNLTHRLGFSGMPIVFTWPSHRGEEKGVVADVKGLGWYLYDLQSANFSRDALFKSLDDLAGLSNVGRIHIVAHSMGSWLTMEALRQAAIAGRTNILEKVSDVVLLAPDVDAQVFEKQVASVNTPTPVPVLVFLPGIQFFAQASPSARRFSERIFVFAGSDDWAIGLSSWLSGAPRVGVSPSYSPRA